MTKYLLSTDSMRNLVLSNCRFDFEIFENLLEEFTKRGIFIYLNSEELCSPELCEYIFGSGDSSTYLMKLLYNNKQILTYNHEDEENLVFIGFKSSGHNHIAEIHEFRDHLLQELISINQYELFFEKLKIVFCEMVFMDYIVDKINCFDFSVSSNREIIAKHLFAICYNFQDIYNDNKSSGSANAMNIFGSSNCISASCESDRELVRNHRTVKLINKKNIDQTLELKFELHTKLDITNLHERIYFNVGVDNIKGGSIIVAHIGRHLFDPNSGIRANFDTLPETFLIDFD